MNLHEVKIDCQYFPNVLDGSKTFELLKNDRDFKVGDYLLLKEVIDDEYTGRWAGLFPITYILYGGFYALPKGYVILSFGKRLINEGEKPKNPFQFMGNNNEIFIAELYASCKHNFIKHDSLFMKCQNCGLIISSR